MARPGAAREHEGTDETRNTDVALVIDISGSMSETTSPGGPTKLEAAREAARSFLGSWWPAATRPP